MSTSLPQRRRFLHRLRHRTANVLLLLPLVSYLARVFEGLPTNEFQNERWLRRRKAFAHVVFGFVLSFLLALILTEKRKHLLLPPVFRAGEVCDRDIYSPLSARVRKKAETKDSRNQLGVQVAPVFDYDENLLEVWVRRWEMSFRKIRDEFYGPKRLTPRPTLAMIGNRLSALSGQNLSPGDLKFLHQNEFSKDLETEFIEVAQLLFGRLITTSNLFPHYAHTGIELRFLDDTRRTTTLQDLSHVWSTDQAREYLYRMSLSSRTAKSKSRAPVTSIVASLIPPNVRLNTSATQSKLAQQVAAQLPTVVQIQKNQLIIRRGDRFSEEHIELLTNLEQLTSSFSITLRFIAVFLVLSALTLAVLRFNLTGRAFWNFSLRDAMVFGSISVLTLLLVRLMYPFLKTLFAPILNGFAVEYLFPVSAGSIIVHLMLGKEASLAFSLLMSLSMGYFLEQNYAFALYTFLVSVTAVQTIKSCKQRTDLYRAGAWSGGVGAVLVLAFSLGQFVSTRTFDVRLFALNGVTAFAAGFFSAILTSSLIPIFEALFGYTTSLKLLELSNFNHPLLHDLMMKAPGTYHHSVIVGSLAELAADRIKANGLLARVSSYYHDIGKMTKPLYFIENQSNHHNPHDHLQPSMSAKILFSHVKEGSRLGKVHGLGKSIVSIIEQHHGTTLVSYFFNKAKKLEKPELDPIEETHFRYPGPKPQSREAAIVMLADACEAATRSISDPTAAKIQAMVHNIINRRFLEDQFSECDLTLKDLRIIEDTFTRTLVSLYHHRIEYPGQRRDGTTAPTTPPAKKPGRDKQTA